jgi:hypothetical protein
MVCWRFVGCGREVEEVVNAEGRAMSGASMMCGFVGYHWTVLSVAGGHGRLTTSALFVGAPPLIIICVDKEITE